ncbi:MAG: hypothetical protein RLZZ174_517 [Pseudomonadota bacterium]
MPLATPVKLLKASPRAPRRSGWVRTVAALCLLVGAGAVRAAPGEEGVLDAPEGLRNHLANWSSLSDDERRAVLTSLHRQLAEAGREGKLQVRSERRFGYRVQRPDGTVLRIERRQAVVQFRDAEGASFGVGFEQRLAHPEAGRGPASQQVGLGLIPLPLDDRLEDLPVALSAGDETLP